MKAFLTRVIHEDYLKDMGSIKSLGIVQFPGLAKVRHHYYLNRKGIKCLLGPGEKTAWTWPLEWRSDL
jgi:hypothetical protein